MSTSSSLNGKQDRAFKVLIVDLIGLKFDANGNPDHSEVKSYIEARGGIFHEGPIHDREDLEAGKIYFSYQPALSRDDELLPITDKGQYDAVIAAATFLPEASVFAEGGVRIGAGTGNMKSTSWGGGDGAGGSAPLMNTPSFNSRATAQMVMKALLKVIPDINVTELHDRVCTGSFDTGKNLCEYPTEKLEGKTIAVLGYGNIGREVACLAKAFGMTAKIFARPHHREWIESEGFEYSATALEAANGADVLSPHTGLGALDPETGTFSNAGVVGKDVLAQLNPGAIIINYDRGEVIDAEALDTAMASGHVRYAAIDADLFCDGETGELSGPMVPYLTLVKKYPDRMELLPHAAADTEHVSRVEGAKQAVDQIMACIQHRRVHNLKGDLPPGYTDAGPVTVNGVGKVTVATLSAASNDTEVLSAFAAHASDLNRLWNSLHNADSPQMRKRLIEEIGPELTLVSNRYISLAERFGLKGPFG